VPAVYLGLGSNKGRSSEILASAAARLSSVIKDLRASSVYLSRPLYVTDQADFLNMAATGECSLTPLGLLDAVQAIEADFGRDRSSERPKGERSLDIDILLYGEEDILHPRLVVPHPRMLERKFVLLPLLELEPELALPDGRRLAEAYDALGTQGIYYSSLTGYSLPQSQ
jgi:2-amino-4-hydroxy-6-hydroxymethyldihydropteridine diphosphokinase